MFSLKKGIKILIVDDEPEILRTMKRILERKDYVVVTFENPVPALEYLKTERVHLILSDLKMPVMDGMQFLAQVKKSYPSIPVVLITGHATISTAVAAIQLGAADYLKKPFEIKKIYEVVQRNLGLPKGEDED